MTSTTYLPGKPPARLVASKRHTTILLLILLVITVGGAFSQRLTSGADWGHGERLRIYAQIIVVQWLLFWYAGAGIRGSGGTVRGLMDESPWKASRFALYLGIAVAGWILWTAIGMAMGKILRLGPEELGAMQRLLPHGPLEKACWVAVALTAGLCEEFTYRGYLLRQFGTMTRSVTAGVFLQALVYGSTHLALPLKVVASVTVLGLVLGALAAWRKSIVPAMILHAGIALGALLAPT